MLAHDANALPQHQALVRVRSTISIFDARAE
jgi:hypothetical protein